LETLPAPASLVGHSMGGLAACLAAAERPGLVRDIYLEDVTPLFLANTNAASYPLLGYVFSVGGLVDELRQKSLSSFWLAEQMAGFAYDEHRTVGEVLRPEAIL